MQYLAIFLLIILSGTACKDKATTSLRTKKAARIILPDKKAKYQRWVLAQMYDPYQQGYTYYGDTTNPTYLEIYKNGRFKQFQKDQHSEGEWKLNKTREKLALIYEIRKGIEVPEDLRDDFFRYEIDKLSKDTLQLAIPGRHGLLKELWLRDTLSLPFPTDTISVDSLFEGIQTIDSSKSSNR